MNKQAISIIVPVLNEQDNVISLVKRIDKSLGKNEYEVIFIDDHSGDLTVRRIKKLAKTYPLRVYEKVSIPGKAQSLIEGFSYAKYSVLCMIDADLQYPPEAIPSMLAKILRGADVVVANRKDKKTSILRKAISVTNRVLIGKILHNFDVDIQSGLKVFKKEVVDNAILSPEPWTFDLDFLLQARNNLYIIKSIDITFAERLSGKAKINLVTGSLQIGLNAIYLKFRSTKKLAPKPNITLDITKIT